MCQKRFQSWDWKYRSINLIRSAHINQTSLYNTGKMILIRGLQALGGPELQNDSSARQLYCKSRCEISADRHTQPHSSPRVFFSFLVSNLGATTPAVQPLINVICFGLHTDHGTRKEESSLPSWKHEHAVILPPLAQSWPTYSHLLVLFSLGCRLHKR